MAEKTKLFDLIMYILVIFFTLLTVGFIIWIVGFIIIKGIPNISWSFLTSDYYSDDKGILPMLVNTVSMVLLTLLVSVPVGISAAIYLVEYAREGLIVRIIRFTTETLAGIPSIVYGLFGMVFFVTILKFSWSLLSGALTLSVIVLPTIIRTTEESLKTVPIEYKEGSLALGATKLVTIVKVILPVALPGIISAVILSIGRIVGETAALIFTSGMVPKIADSIMNSGRTLSLHLYQLTREGTSLDQAYGTAFILLIVVLIINFLSNIMGRLIKRKSTGGIR